MRVCTVLLLFLLLCEGFPDPGFTDIPVYKPVEGEDVTAKCSFIFSGSEKIFCKNDCNKEEDILVETSGNSHENGRYSLRYEGKNIEKDMTVSIKKVKTSDSGRYWCKLERRLLLDKYEEFWIEVTKAPTASVKPAPPKPPLTTSTTAVSTAQGPGPGTTQSPGPGTTQSPGPGPTSGTSGHLSTAHGDTSTAVGSLLSVALTVAVILILCSVALIIFYCRKKNNRSEEAPVNTEYEVPEPEYENHRPEDCTYQSLSLDTIDPNQTYCTISVQQRAPLTVNLQ